MITLVDHPAPCPVCGRTFYITGDVIQSTATIEFDYFELSEPDPADPEVEAIWYHGWEVPECPYCSVPLRIIL